jgi:hypothetical protein
MRTKEEIRKEIDAVDETIKVTLHLTPDEITWLNMVVDFGGEISSVMCGKKIVGKPTEYPVSEYNKWHEVQYGLFHKVRIKPDEDQD